MAENKPKLMTILFQNLFFHNPDYHSASPKKGKKGLVAGL